MADYKTMTTQTIWSLYMKFLKPILTSAAVLSLAFSGTVQAGFEQANWYLQVDMPAYNGSELSKKLVNEAGEEPGIILAIMGKDIAEQAKTVVLYGTELEEDGLSVLVEGKFAANKNAIVKFWQESGLTESKKVNGTAIYSGIYEPKELEKHNTATTVDEDGNVVEGSNKVNINFDKDNDTKVYASIYSDSLIVMSKSAQEVESWLNNQYKWQPDAQQGVFKVVVDIEKALMHGGINLDEAQEAIQFESISAKQLVQVSAKYQEFDNQAELQVGLQTKDFETANQIKSVVNGLIALQMLASEDQDMKNLLANLRIEHNGENILLTLAGPIDNFNRVLND